MKFFFNIIFAITVFASFAEAQSTQCLALFSQRAPVLLGEGQGGVVHRIFVQGKGFIAQKMYFEKDELINDQRAFEALRALKIPGVRIVRWLAQKEYVVDVEYVEGVPLSSVPPSHALYRQYEQYLSTLRDIFSDRISGVKNLDHYESREDGQWRLSVALRENGKTVYILLRPQNFIISDGILFLIDPH